MGTPRDTWPAIYKRVLKKLRRNAAELERYGWEVKEPPNADTPPPKPVI
jgi:hypothetical protein